MQLRRPIWAACSTWAARRWRTTSRSWRRVALIPTSNLAHLLLQTARRFPDRPGAHLAATAPGPGPSSPRRVRRAAGALRERGVRHGDRILLHARNSNAVLETMFASWMLGAVWVPTNFRLTPPEVAYLAQSSGASVHIFDARSRPCRRGARGKPGVAACEIGRSAADWEALRPSRSTSRAPGRRRSRPSGLVLLHLRHDRPAQGRRADAWPDGIRRQQPSVRPDAGHDRERRLPGRRAAVARRRHPRAAAGRARRRPRSCCPASGWTATRPGSWSSAIASPTCSPCRPS